METIELNIKEVNTYGQDEYIIADFELEKESIELLASKMEVDEDTALEWFYDNYLPDNEKINIVPFFNQTISKKDFQVYYEADFTATYNDIKFIAHIDITQTEMYKNTEVLNLINKYIYEVQEPQAIAKNGEKLYLLDTHTYVDKDYNEYVEDDEIGEYILEDK